MHLAPVPYISSPIFLYFCEKKNSKPFIVGGNGMPLEEFFATDPNKLFL